MSERIAEAEAAAMREALENVRLRAIGAPGDSKSDDSAWHSLANFVEAALSSDAGKSLLAERDQLRAWLDERQAALLKQVQAYDQLRAKVERARQLARGYFNLLITKCDACDNDVDGVYCECDTLNRCRDQALAELRAALAEEGK